MNRILIFTLCLLSAGALINSPAFAQADDDLPEAQTYDPTYTGQRNETADYIRDLQKKSQVDKGYIKPQVVQVSIVHPSYMDKDQFGIQMAVPDVLSGCYSFTPLEYEAKFVDPYYLDITVKKYRRVAPEGIKGTEVCDQKNKMSTALMVLSKADLLKRGTQEIRFSTSAATDSYKILLDDAHLELIPRSMLVFKPQNFSGALKDRITYNFSGEKTVVLQIPMANPGEDVTQQILQFAKLRALSPANPEKLASWGGNGLASYYFTDQNGHIAAKIGEKGYATLGTISVDRPYDGPDGRTTTPVNLSVFVTLPGTDL